VVFDLHGSVAALCTAGTTTLTDAYRYDGWGQTIATYPSSGATANPWKYRGLLGIDPSSSSDKLYDMGARDYAPGTGTFTQLDSVQGQAINPMTMNRFLYALANPATLIDPDGHNACMETDDGRCVNTADMNEQLAENQQQGRKEQQERQEHDQQRYETGCRKAGVCAEGESQSVVPPNAPCFDRGCEQWDIDPTLIFGMAGGDLKQFKYAAELAQQRILDDYGVRVRFTAADMRQVHLNKPPPREGGGSRDAAVEDLVEAFVDHWAARDAHQRAEQDSRSNAQIDWSDGLSEWEMSEYPDQVMVWTLFGQKSGPLTAPVPGPVPNPVSVPAPPPLPVPRPIFFFRLSFIW
jgi:RHS repeat-associated protein